MLKLGWKGFRKEDPQWQRWQKAFQSKRVRLSLLAIAFVAFLSVTAEFWSNSKPLLMRLHGKWYFPVIEKVHPSELGITDRLSVDFRELKFEAADFAWWPINRWDPFESNKTVESYPSPPSRENWMGTDDRGRDIFARILYGYRYSLSYAILVWAITVVVAVFAGGMMGYFGGWVDLVGQRVVEVLSTVPTLFLLIILVSIFEPTLFLLVLLTSAFSWIGLSYYMRAEFLKNRKLEYVEAARAIGVRSPVIVVKHLLRNSLIPILTFSPFILSAQILGLASLDYLGFGLTPPTPSWGELLNQAKNHFTTSWWLAVFPSLALFSTLVAFAWIGEGLRKAFDPKQ